MNRGMLWCLGALLVLASASAAAQSFNGGLTGAWWDPARGGEGQFLSFESVGDRDVAVLAYFTYDDEGRARWLVGDANFTPGQTVLEFSMLTGRGPRFGVGFRSEDVIISQVGSIRLEVLSCDRMRLRYTDDEQQFETEIRRLVGPLEGVACDGSQTSTGTNRMVGTASGGWWDSARGGEGSFISFERAGDRRVISVYYFTYDDEGRATWLVGDADHTERANRIEVQLFTGSGARFGLDFDSADVRIRPAGRAIIEQDGCGNMRMRYNGSVTFGLDLTRLVGELSGVSCSIPMLPPNETDNQLRALIAQHGLIGDPSRGRDLPGIDSPLAQLGKLLFFSKSLSGDLDTACASCHHPALGGADGLALPVGATALNPDVMGPGRRTVNGHLLVGRNSQTFFNTALYDTGLFWDSRVESLNPQAGDNGEMGGIRTPDSAFGSADSRAGPNLLAAQARFPVVEPGEMLGTGFPGMNDEQVRAHLAARIGNYGSGAGRLPPSQWLQRFREVFGSDASAEELITFDNIALALGEYQRSAVFVETPWARYVRGDNAAISASAKIGALVFYRPVNQAGGNCVQCHSGDFFTDEKHHVIGFPQVGPGLGDPNGNDHGRARHSGRDRDMQAFRTPSLLNVNLTAPYGHSGSYNSLTEVFAHYVLTRDTALQAVDFQTWCFIAPFNTEPGCNGATARVRANTMASLARVDAIRLSDPANALPIVDPVAVPQAATTNVLAFMRALTDPCLQSRACFGRWIPTPEEAPDAFQLNAVNANGDPL
jgi:cytochrome c peroxidase